MIVETETRNEIFTEKFCVCTIDGEYLIMEIMEISMNEIPFLSWFRCDGYSEISRIVFFFFEANFLEYNQSEWKYLRATDRVFEEEVRLEIRIFIRQKIFSRIQSIFTKYPKFLHFSRSNLFLIYVFDRIFDYHVILFILHLVQFEHRILVN